LPHILSYQKRQPKKEEKKASFVLTLLAVNTSGTDAESDPENGKKRLHSISDVFGL